MEPNIRPRQGEWKINWKIYGYMVVVIAVMATVIVAGCLHNQSVPPNMSHPTPTPGTKIPVKPTPKSPVKSTPKPTIAQVKPMFCNQTIKCRFSNMTCVNSTCKEA